MCDALVNAGSFLPEFIEAYRVQSQKPRPDDALGRFHHTMKVVPFSGCAAGVPALLSLFFLCSDLDSS